MKIISLIWLFLFFTTNSNHDNSPKWGFYGHKLINRLAVFSLPPEMIIFYKPHINFLSNHSVDPDKRRYVMPNEAPRHFIDLDRFDKEELQDIPENWAAAVTKYTLDTLMDRGVVPWHITKVKYQLTEAFRQLNFQRILKLSADIGHYIADANVPLHTTSNYNGQLSNQHGIHGFWESRIPEISADNYDLFVGKANYLSNPGAIIWQAVFDAHSAVDSVLFYEKELSKQISADKKYSFEDRNGVTLRVYSRFFTLKYEKTLDGQVERQLKSSVKMVADFWYTAWVDSGQPPLHQIVSDTLLNHLEETLQQESLHWQGKGINSRPHEN